MLVVAWVCSDSLLVIDSDTILEAMGLYDSICRRVMALVAPQLLEECASVPPEYSHSGILDAFAYFNAQPEAAAAESKPEPAEDAYK